MSYAIDFINTTKPTVEYDYEGYNDPIDELTVKFESDYADQMRGCDSDDIGGLIVYTNAGDVRAVYDYENFCGWVK